MNYAVVMTWNNTAQALLLERNLFKPPQDLADCCCWSGDNCYQTWPSDEGTPVNLTAAMKARCSSGCDGDANRAPPLNVTASQKDHLDCGQAAPLYGLKVAPTW